MPKPISIGSVLPNLTTAPQIAAQLSLRGSQAFDTAQLAWKNTLGGLDLAEAAAAAQSAMASGGCSVSCLGIYGNTLTEDAHGEEIRTTLRSLILHARHFGTDLVCGFTGRVPGRPVPESIPRFREVFLELTDLAGEHGIRLALENCTQGGNWQHGTRNLAFCEDAWELLFQAVPAANLGLEWEPAHHLCQLVEPTAPLRRWGHRVFHIHGKDAQIQPELLARHGISGAHWWAFHRFPGLGDSNWPQLISQLHQQHYEGSIDIEGGHDPIYRGPLEEAGQLLALAHLRASSPPKHAFPIT